ncbi:MAG: hypothetical protein HC892_18695 [Saprospiraceae bacterium]|nr:hypothetical protein [Saprospiraceae bacterium]
MLEGQVAALSAGFVQGTEALEILDALRNSALYRPDQHSYMLYPNKDLPKFLEKNIIPQEKVAQSQLLMQLHRNNNLQIINQDIKGNYHFNGNFHNANDVIVALQELKEQEEYKALVANDTKKVLQIFEDVFNHKAFTGRSGTFFAYEGLGSIYWHMVSKLHIAVYEICEKAFAHHEDKKITNALLVHFNEIGAGIGVHKSPEVYGAFPTDPYSHTPLHRGAQQPGMTGQVKEDILTRIGELGVNIKDGKLQFQPIMLRKSEFLTQAQEVTFVMVDKTHQTLKLQKESLAFTVCQVPVIYKMDASNQIEVHYANGSKAVFDTSVLSLEDSKKVFQRYWGNYSNRSES